MAGSAPSVGHGGALQPLPLSKLLARSRDPGVRTTARGGRRHAAQAGSRRAGAREAPAQRHEQAASSAQSPAGALGLLMAVRPGACPPGEAVAPAGLLQAGPERGGPPPPPPARGALLGEPPQRSAASPDRLLGPRLARSAPASPRRGGGLEIDTALISEGPDDEHALPFMISTPTESIREGMLLTPRAEAMTWPPTPSPEVIYAPRAEVMSWPCAATPTGPEGRGRQPPAPILSLAEALQHDKRPRRAGDPLAAGASLAGPVAVAAGSGPGAVADARQELGSAALPSRGSALHRYGACKPCAFVYREGCRGSTECQFCHLCDPGERKARKRERLAAKRDVRDEARHRRVQDAIATGRPVGQIKGGGC